MRVAGVPFDQGTHPAGSLTPTAIVLHRTFGAWAGDYAVGKHGRGSEPIGFHFLIGKAEGHWVQFYDTSTLCYHAKGANSWAVGIECEGTNAEALTDWQVRALRWILTAVCNAHGIPKTYTNDGARRKVNGCLSHSVVPGSTHTDYVSDADWNRAMGVAPVVLPDRPAIHLNDTGHLVDILHWELAVITSSHDNPAGRGPELQLDNGTYGLHTAHVLQDLDKLLAGDWGDSTTCTPEMWRQIDFLYLATGHTPGV